MKKSQEVLLKLLANELFQCNNKIEDLSESEWRDVIKESCDQAVTIISYNAAVKACLPDSINQLWADVVDNYVAKNMMAEYDHIVLHEWMTEANIPYVILKGSSSAYYYPNALERTMGDVDFLVKKEDIARGEEILRNQGLKLLEVDHICHIVYRNGDHHYEMHFDLSGVPNGKPGELVHEYIKDIFDKSFVYSSDNGEMVIPSKFHHGLIILLHTSHHLTGEGVGLRHLCDWAVFLESCSNDEFKELFEDKFKAIGMWKFASVLSKICIIHLGCTPKECLENVDEEITESLIEDILFGGNFGKKDSENRHLEARLISDRGKSGMNKKSMVGYFIGSVNESIRNHWPITRKIPIIIPFGWIFFGCQRVIKVVFGKGRFANVKSTIGEAGKRKELYSKLGIFETEK